MITLQCRHPQFITVQDRVWFAKFLATTIDGGDGSPVYHQTNTGDDYHHGIGRGNDWWVRFEEDHSSFSLTYRYQCEAVQAEEALTAWLLFRLSGVKLKEKT